MPLYEYQCDACDVRFERIRKFSDPPLDACPTCGGTVRKLLSSPAIQFKGSGFYITDYPKKSSADPSRSSSDNNKSSSDGGKSASDSGKSSSDSGKSSSDASKNTSSSGGS